MTSQTLPGLRPTPLASYLAGLGLVRVLGEQADPALTAAWTADGLTIHTTVDDLAQWLVDRYVPTPVLSPWNSGSGFGEKDKVPKETLDALLAMPDPRLDPFRAAVKVATEVGRRFRAGGWSKERAVRELRNWCPEELLPWIDATVVLAGDQPYFPPLLGTGGNDGRLDFSTTFHQRLRDLLDPAAKPRGRATTHARDLLEGRQVERLHKAMIGQFDPAGAGGKGSSPFGDADSLANPWLLVLLVEGATLFASTAVRRHQHAVGRAAMPFTVISSPDGSASGAQGEASRGEVWAPLWNRPFTLPEIKQLFAEARASWRGRPAQRAVEFYAATRTLGVSRGVSGFERYGLQQRNGLAFVAVPVEQVAVTQMRAVRLAARLEDWVSWVRRGEASTAVGGAVRRFETAHLEFARNGDPGSLRRLLAAVTDVELAVGRSGRARDSVQVRVPPFAHDFLAEFRRIESRELRVAVGIASCAARAGTDPARQPARTMRQLLLPIDADRRWRETPVVGGFGLRPLRAVLADVLVWRSRTAPDEPDPVTYRGVPTFRTGIRVPDADLHAFARGDLDESVLAEWLRACLALRWDGVTCEWADPGLPEQPVPLLGLLHPFSHGLALSPTEADRDAARLGLSPDWPVQLTAGRSATVHELAVRRLQQAGWRAAPPLRAADVSGSAVAAALVPRCRTPQRVLRTHLAVPIRTDETKEETEVTPQALVEEMP